MDELFDITDTDSHVTFHIYPHVEIVTVTPDPIITLGHAATNCYGVDGMKKDNPKKYYLEVIRKCMNSGHLSILEHVAFTARITCSRACSHQLVRTRHASYSQQSQRYIDYRKQDKIDVFIPPKIAKDKATKEEYTKAIEQMITCAKTISRINPHLPSEDVRYLYPNALATTIIMSMNLHSLITTCQVRRCFRAQWEIRSVYDQLIKALKATSEDLSILLDHGLFGAKCQVTGICTESHGKCPTIPKMQL